MPPSRSRSRPILPGGYYAPAPTTRRDPRDQAEEADRGLPGDAQAIDARRLIATFNGFSPFAAEELLSRAVSADAGSVDAALSHLHVIARIELQPELDLTPRRPRIAVAQARGQVLAGRRGELNITIPRRERLL